MERFVSLFGLVVLVGIAWLLSADRKKVKWRPVVWGVALQLGIGVVILIPAVGQTLFTWIDAGINELLSYSNEGSQFLFQRLVPHSVDMVTDDGLVATAVPRGQASPPLISFAFFILPTVIFFSALMAVLYHYGLMQRLVNLFSKVMQRTMGTSGAESLSAASNVFLGQTEAPLVIEPFVGNMTKSELNAVMVGGFATVAGGVMAIYGGLLAGTVPGIAGHLVMASLMSAPAALALAKVMLPETGHPTTSEGATVDFETEDANGLDAVTRGTLMGLKLCLNIAAMLLVFVAFIAMANGILSGISSLAGLEEALTLEGILGWIFSPMAFLMGIPWAEAQTAGMLLGEKMVLTELIAYIHFGDIQSGAAGVEPLSERSAIIMSYALCGFANFASIGIQIGGIGGIAPERRKDLALIGFRAMIGGTLAAMMTGTVAGILF